MAIRYAIEALLQLRESPLCTKPTNLPPAEEWMGPPIDNLRNTPGNNKPTHDRVKTGDGALLDQGGRRSHVSRTSEDLILGPNRNPFPSTAFLRGATDKTVTKDGEIRGDQRFPFRTRNGESSEGNDRFRNTRDRDGRNNLRPRGDTDQDSDGWVPVKPRKSFGHEGAERFHGRMGDRPDRFGGDRRPRDEEDRENGDRPRRNFGEFGRDKDTDTGDRPRRNGLTRNRPDQPAWARETTPQNNDSAAPRGFDRGKSWRDRAPADNHSYDNNQHDKPRWGDRDQRQEHAPEWMDEPAAPEEKPLAPTMDDMKKFMESMKASKAAPEPETVTSSALEDEPIKATSNSTPTVELNRDKYFAFGPSPVAADASVAGHPAEPAKDSVTAPKPKSGSRFQNFFSAQEESRRIGDSPAPGPVPSMPPPPQPLREADSNPLLAALAGGAQGGTKPDEEKVAFQALLSKLKGQTPQASTPPSVGFSEPPPSHEFGPKSAVGSPAAFSPYGQERREDPMARFVPPQPQEQHITRPHQTPNNEPMRPEQQLYEMLGQRHGAPVHTAQPVRSEAPPSRSNNNNAEFLMTLMQSSRQNQPSIPMPPSRSSHIPQTPEQELESQHRERSASQHQNRRPMGLPSFFDEPGLPPRGQDSRPQQPTQILQRQGPPGLDQMPPLPSWMQNPNQQQPPPGRPMMPPPGLAGNPRNAPVPGMFPPNFPMGAFPPEGMPVPPRNMAPPPGFYGGLPGAPPGAPPGFLPPPGIGGFQGPDAMGFGFDGRGMPPPGPGGPFPRRS